MRISLKWLKEWLKLDRTPEETADLLTLAGLEVEGIESTKFPFTNVVFAKVLETKQHPDADKLSIATVTDGEGTFQVVCGASNCRKDLITACARVGAKLTDDKGREFAIKKGKLRGVESFGMLCAKDELGLSLEKEPGIAEFDDESLVGKPLDEVLGDTFLELSLTPNLGHCMSVLGIARELSALTQIPLQLPSFKVDEESSNRNIAVEVKERDLCPRYCTRLIEDVKIGPSPAWLREKLEEAGFKSKNAVVDVTNYIMFELGQPMHAFDADKVAGDQIIVKTANKEHTLTTLDGEERKIHQGALLICDAEKPLAVAGVMGGDKSAVSEDTTSVLLEAAFFDPSTVRSSSKKMHLRTDSSSRFEKGTDPNMTLQALDRAAKIIQEICGGRVGKSIDAKTQEFAPRKVDLRLSRTNKLLGIRLSLGELEGLIKRLEFSLRSDGKEKLHVNVPAYRHDIQEEIDLIEEVARLYGYNAIPMSLPKVSISTIPQHPLFALEREVRGRLVAEGLQEFLTCDLISSKLSKLGLEDEMHEEKLIHVLKAASVDQSILRSSLLPGHLQAVHLNRNFQCEEIQAFELGKIHFKEGDQYLEKSVIAITLTGHEAPYHHAPKPRKVDFFTLKGVIENLLTGLKIEEAKWEKSELNSFHPNIQATISIKGRQIGSLGQVHPTIAAEMGLKNPIFFAELDLEAILACIKGPHIMEALPLYPGSTRDLTLTLDQEVTFEQIQAAVKQTRSPLLKKMSLLDIFESEQLGSNKNITLRFTYRNDKKTLKLETVETMHTKLVESISKSLNIN